MQIKKEKQKEENVLVVLLVSAADAKRRYPVSLEIISAPVSKRHSMSCHAKTCKGMNCHGIKWHGIDET